MTRGPLARHPGVVAAAGITLALAGGLLAWCQGLPPGQGLRAVYRAEPGGPVLRERVEPGIDGDAGRWPAGLPAALTVEWSGTIGFPRDRAYLAVGADGEPPAVFVDGARVGVARFAFDSMEYRLDGTPSPLPAGAHSLRVEYRVASPTARIRMLWIAPGRRGLPEYVPPAMLRPTDDRRPYPASGTDCFFREALTVTAILVLALGWILFLTRRKLARGLRALATSPGGPRFLLLSGAVLLASLGVRLWNLGGAGQTWDEDVHWSPARDFAYNLAHLDLRNGSWRWMGSGHPTATPTLYGALALWGSDLDLGRLTACAFGLATIAAVIAITTRVFSRTAGLLAGLFLGLLPPAIAYQKNVSHEALIGLVFVVCVCLYLRLFARERPGPALYAGAGIASGVALAVRMTDGVLVPLSALAAALALRAGIGVRQAIFRLGALWAIASVAFFAAWPFAWTRPVAVVRAHFALHGAVSANEWFLGRWIERAPLHYLPVYFVATLPLGILLLLAIGVARGCADRRLETRILLGALVVPFLVGLGPAVKDGVRYAFPALVIGAMFAGVGAAWALGRLPPRPRMLAAAAVVAYLAATCVRIHPYHLDYYNELTGGPESVRRRRLFELAWWGEGLGEAVAVVDRLAPKGDSIWLAAEPKHVMQWRDDLVRFDHDGADWVVCNAAGGLACDQIPGYDTVHVVWAQGAPLAWVLRRRAR